MVKKASKKAYHLVKEVLKKQKENESVATPKKQMFGDFEYCQVKRRIKLISYHGKEKELAVPASKADDAYDNELKKVILEDYNPHKTSMRCKLIETNK